MTSDPPASPPRVLIADDDAVVRSALSLQLNTGFVVIASARDADEAIEQAQALRPDIAILDVQMPGGGGLRATREIREHAPEVAIVALSSDESDAMVRAMVQAGAMAYVRKGVGAEELRDVLLSSLAGHAALAQREHTED
jgi:DNA-binding NarL/FixJ family response regulator